MISVAWKIARRELRGGLRGFWVFLACLALGVGAIAAVGSVRGAIDDGLAREGATLLGGDAELRMTYRFATPEERDWIDSFAAQVSEVVDFRSMAVAGQGDSAERSVTQVKGVDGAYPLVGSVGLDPPIPLDEALAEEDGLPGAVMERILAERLGLQMGDTFRLGVQEFSLRAHITREPDGLGANFGFGPRTLVRSDALENAELLGPGTLYEVNYRLLLPGQSLDQARGLVQAQFDGAGVRWRDSRNAAPQIRNVIERVSSFLVLVGLAGLAVGGVGVSAAVRTYLDGKTNVIATLKTLGAESRTIFAVYLMQIGVLTVIGLALGLALGAVVPFAVAPLVADQIPIELEITVQSRALIEAALYGALTALIFTLWPLARTEHVRAATIFRGVAEASKGWPRWPYLLVTLALVVGLVLVAAGFAAVPYLAYATAGGVIGALAVLSLAALLVRFIARKLARSRALRGRTALRMAMGAIANPREGATAVILSLGLGLTVLAAVGQIDSNLRRAIALDLPDRAPSYFFLDIQNHQLEGFLERLAADENVDRVDTAPMLRGVVTELNGIPAREHPAWGHWVLRGDRGITYSATIPEGTTLVGGEWWDEDYSGPPLVSFAIEEAQELGLSLGDTVTANVLGRDITATIASFREVDFSTGGIGFVMLMSPEPLRSAPHTHISTVYALEAAEGAILRDLSNMFPNITAIRVREAAERVTEALSTMATATSYAALATLLTGFVVLIGAAAAGERARVYEAAVMKTLGATRAGILASFALRSALMGAAAGLVALAAAALASWAVMRFVMQSSYQFEPVSAVLIVLGGILATLLAGLVFALRPLAVRPAQTLRAQD
ncbi:putative ABC transport system permease protein [Roseinatronobacter thiooxidans]|uniref:Putative ABC transport system permease protein n=1 Tax=Roseinatronobacter thiooxidans TaxID=121821 RepID=A0A2W7QDX2_9RHOB|nr:FtsX-like permease family protein [Roseinatronobacter thiooxidans]PZX42327.1 putative ABC transport system permease protein [Roseinatronobacter thiooxidans]